VLGDLNAWPGLALLNKISPPYIIEPGQVLTLPTPTLVATAARPPAVSMSDTAVSLARRLGLADFDWRKNIPIILLLIAGAGFILNDVLKPKKKKGRKRVSRRK